MRTHEEQIITCLEWLDEQVVIKTMNRKRRSYHCRVIIQDWSNEYVTEDAFIDAIKIRNIPHSKVSKDHKSIFVGLSEKQIRKYVDRRIKHRSGFVFTIPALKRTVHE